MNTSFLLAPSFQWLSPARCALPSRSRRITKQRPNTSTHPFSQSRLFFLPVLGTGTALCNSHGYYDVSCVYSFNGTQEEEIFAVGQGCCGDLSLGASLASSTRWHSHRIH
jgi:hypothetical protein